MIRLETIDVQGFRPAIHGMRNPKNSWYKSDSLMNTDGAFALGDNDKKLALQLASGGPVHAKYRRMITVWVDITAPMYWWAEFDTYKVGTVRNSCSKMHKLLAKPFEMSDFSFNKLPGYKYTDRANIYEEVARPLVDTLNKLRDSYLSCDDEAARKKIWYSIIQLLPESYNQRSTVMLNYEVLANICKHRAGHKLDEWHWFLDWAKTLPYPELFMEASDEHGDGD